MAPQRRSQRQRSAAAAVDAAAKITAVAKVEATGCDLEQAPTNSADCAPQVDQHHHHQEEAPATEACELPPTKRQRRPTKSPSGASTPQLVAPVSQMEADRAARIAANKARLAELELPELAAKLAAAAAAAAAQRSSSRPAAQQRGISSKRSRSAQQQLLPQRQSARARGQAPDPTTAGGIDYEARDGSVVLAAFVPERYTGTSAAAAAAAHGSSDAAAVSRPPPGPLPFRSSNGDESSDAAFLQHLRATAAAGARDSSSSSSADGVLGAAGLMGLQLAPVDVAKLTTQGVSCLAFHPSSSRPIIAAADKSGKVGLWDIDYPQAPDDDDGDDDGDQKGSDGRASNNISKRKTSSSVYDGVLMFEPHRDYVSSLKWLGPSGGALLTGSYDGTVRRLDVETGVWDVLGGVPSSVDDDNNWSAGDATPDGSTIYLATSAGLLTKLDTRCSSTSPAAAAASSPVLIANRKVNTLHLHADQTHLLSSASDGTVAVWDVRQLAETAASSSSSRAKLAKPLAAGTHYKSSQGAYWEPGGGKRVLSISFDDTLRIWQLSAGGLTQQVLIKHNNNTGRWVMPFRPTWAPAGDAVCVGDLKRGVAVFKDSGGPAVGVLQAPEALTAIPSRVAMHPDGLMAAATSSGRVHIFR